MRRFFFYIFAGKQMKSSSPYPCIAAEGFPSPLQNRARYGKEIFITYHYGIESKIRTAH